jgi:hypothetical protein
VALRRREYFSGRPAGYHFYKSPPLLKTPPEMKKIFNLREGDPTQFIWVHRDGIQLIAQRILLIWLTVNALILSPGRGPLLIRVLFWIFFCFGGACVVLLLWRVLI